MNPGVNEPDLARKALLSILEDEKLVREELQKNEARWRSLVQNAPDTITLVDRNAKILFINRVHPGIPVEAVVGTRLYDYMTPENQEVAERAIVQVFTLGEPQEYQVIATPIAGEIHWYDNRVGPIRKGAEVESAIIITTDITERKKAEQDLRNAEEKFSKTFRLSPDIIILTSLKDGLVADVNENAYRITGYGPDELLGMKTTELDIWANPGERDKYIGSLIKDGRVSNFETDFRMKSGEIRTGLISGEIIEIGDDRFILGVIRDITEIKQTEENLRFSEARFSRAFFSSPAGISITRVADGTFLDVNDAFLRMFGFNREETIGRSSAELRILTHEWREKTTGQYQEAGGLNGAELVMQTKSGETIHLLISASVIEVAGEPCYITTMIDITERKKADELLRSTMNRLIETEENLRREASQQLHDQVGQNLTALSINLSFIRSKLSKETEQQFGRKLTDSLSLLEDTITRIRDIMTDLRPSILDDYGLYAALAWSAGKFTERTHIPVKLTGKDLVKRPPVEIKYALFRMTQEALHNVVKHAQATQVWMDLKEEESCITLMISDNGVGFDPEIGRKDSAGTGFGLSTISERMKALGGRCEIRSAPGKGTTVVMEIRGTRDEG